MRKTFSKQRQTDGHRKLGQQNTFHFQRIRENRALITPVTIEKISRNVPHQFSIAEKIVAYHNVQP